jgi:hypothetical protein
MKPLFPIVRLCMTTGVRDACEFDNLMQCVWQHQHSDCGATCDSDKKTNDEAVRDGDRVISAYPIDYREPCKDFSKNWPFTSLGRTIGSLRQPIAEGRLASVDS